MPHIHTWTCVRGGDDVPLLLLSIAFRCCYIWNRNDWEQTDVGNNLCDERRKQMMHARNTHKRTHTHTLLYLHLSMYPSLAHFCLTFECYVFIAVFNSFGISGVHNKLKVSGCYLLLLSSFLSSFSLYSILMHSFVHFLVFLCARLLLAVVCIVFFFF